MMIQRVTHIMGDNSAYEQAQQTALRLFVTDTSRRAIAPVELQSAEGDSESRVPSTVAQNVAKTLNSQLRKEGQALFGKTVQRKIVAHALDILATRANERQSQSSKDVRGIDLLLNNAALLPEWPSELPEGCADDNLLSEYAELVKEVRSLGEEHRKKQSEAKNIEMTSALLDEIPKSVSRYLSITKSAQFVQYLKETADETIGATHKKLTSAGASSKKRQRSGDNDGDDASLLPEERVKRVLESLFRPGGE